MDKPVIRDAKSEHLEMIARCHRLAFPNSLSSAMGVRYVTGMLGWYLSSNTTFLFFIEEAKKCIGYCGGMVVAGNYISGSASGMAQFSFNKGVKAIALRPWLFLHPELIAKYRFILKNLLFKSLRILGIKKTKPNRHMGEPYVSLIVIGVNPQYQRHGYGSKLIKEFERITLEKRIHKMMLTVKSDNHNAIRSYQSNGWQICKVDGKSTTMEKRIE